MITNANTGYALPPKVIFTPNDCPVDSDRLKEKSPLLAINVTVITISDTDYFNPGGIISSG